MTPYRPACKCKHPHDAHPSEGPCDRCKCGEYREKPRRTKGDGGLFKRSDGVYVDRVELPPGPDGKRRRREVSSRDFAVAARELRKLRKEVEDGRITATSGMTVEAWMRIWLTRVHADKMRPTTARDYRATIETHIIPNLGTRRLHKLTPAHIRTMTETIGQSRAAEKAYVVLRRALHDAVREGHIADNPAARIDKPKYRRGKREALDIDTAKHIISTAFASRDESTATRWAAAFMTGARQGELLGLRWTYVDLTGGAIDIAWQLQEIQQAHGCNPPCGKKPGYCPQRYWKLPPDFEYELCHRSLLWTRPKSLAGERWVELPAPLLLALRKLHGQQGINPHNLVWHHADGRPIRPREDYTAWKALLVDAGVIDEGKSLTMHVARHAAATILRGAGVDEQTRMELLGHASAEVQRIYAHPLRQKHADAMGNLGELMPPSIAEIR